MKKVILIAIAAFASLSGYSQIYISKDKTAQIKFFSETPMENIDATSQAVTSILNASNDSIVVRVPVNSFIFPKSLMQEHFNENYLESEKFPMSSFRGKINEKIDFTKNGENKVTCTGNMYMHGVTKLITLNGTLKMADGKVILECKFPVKLKDYNIEVPKLVTQNISESIDVTMNATYSPYVKK